MKGETIMMIPELVWPILVILLLGCVIWLLGDRFGRRGERKSQKFVWIEGKKSVTVDFNSIWNQQQDKFSGTVRQIEQQINDRMLAAIQKSKDDSDPILKELDEFLKRLEKSNPLQNRPTKTPPAGQPGQAAGS